jgi:aminoglycoside phosphotransferase (APT) family kinase protein
MIESRRYSERLGTLTHAQLQAALDRFDLGPLVAAEVAPGGLFGQIVLIETAQGRYAMRGHPHPGQLERERYIAELIHRRSYVAAPWPYLVDDGTDIFGWPFAIMPRLPGVQLAEGEVRRAMSPDDRTGVVRALAECLAAMHGITFDHHGVYEESARYIVPAAKPYAEWWGDWTRWWLDLCRKASVETTDEDVAWVEQIIADARDALAEPFVPVLVHTDFKEGNAVAERSGDGWRISGIFDLAEAHAGDGEVDLSRGYCEYVVREPELAATYVRTYTGLRPPRPGFAERFRHYALHDRLILWEYGQRNGVWFRPGQTLRSFAQRFIEPPAVGGQ